MNDKNSATHSETMGFMSVVSPHDMELKERIELLEINQMIMNANLMDHLYGKEAGDLIRERLKKYEERLKRK